MASIKFQFNNEVRRVLLREELGQHQSLTFAKLENTMLKLFPILTDQHYQMYWLDEDEDLIAFNSDAELDEAIQVMQSSVPKLLRFIIKLVRKDDGAKETPSEPTQARAATSNAVHSMVTCDECGMFPIIGFRFKCAVRKDFDLCSACEAKKIQPFPMLKISDPSQAPEVFVFGLKDDAPSGRASGCDDAPSGRASGCGRWQRGHHPHQTTHHPHVPPQQFNNHGFRNPFSPRPFAEARSHWERKEEKLKKKLEEVHEKLSNTATTAVVAPFVAAMDAFANIQGMNRTKNLETPGKPKNIPASSGKDEARLEEQLIEQAIAESLLDDSSTNPSSSVEGKSVLAVAPAPATISTTNLISAEPIPVSQPPVYIETTRPANLSLPKPALRFVKDVTYPDGTMVQPGAVFRKAWRVRNDGNHNWPEGTVLVNAGGDVMGNIDHKESLPQLQPDQEAELAVQLTAPDVPGMYTSYFRAQTKEQQNFGQRLWASVVVAEHQEADWQHVTAGISPSASVQNTVTANSSTTVSAASTVTKEESALKETILPASLPAPLPVAVPAPAVPAPAAPASIPSDSKSAVEVNPALRSAILLWRRELEILADMGFANTELVLPLLQEHLGSPVSLSGDKSSAPSTEGMQRVVTSLLGLLN